MKYEGHLEAYWEQGWEGRIAYALSIEALTHPFFLEDGQQLMIYAMDGTILWSGRLHFVKRRWWHQHHLPMRIWSEKKQNRVSYWRWMEWFTHDPPLKASVEAYDLQDKQD